MRKSTAKGFAQLGAPAAAAPAKPTLPTLKELLAQAKARVADAKPKAKPKGPDPLAGVKYSDNDIVSDCAQELGELGKGFKQRRENERERFLANTGGDFWFGLVFDDARQKKAFIAAMGWTDLLDDHGSFVDGVSVAKRLNVALEPTAATFPGEKPDRRVAELPAIRRVKS